MQKNDPNYTQLCVWEATVVGKEGINEFEQWLLNDLKVRVKYSEEVKTLPTKDGKGGRNDVFFFIHNEDIGKFAISRLQYGIRWWEDVLNNGGKKLYSNLILEKYPKTW